MQVTEVSSRRNKQRVLGKLLYCYQVWVSAVTYLKGIE